MKNPSVFSYIHRTTALSFDKQIMIYKLNTKHFQYSLESLLAQLPPAELKKYANILINTPSAYEKLKQIVWVRGILASLLNMPIKKLKFSYGIHGKPYIDGRPLHFNYSYSSSLVILAVAQQPIGIDIERIETKRPHKNIVEQWYSSAEKAALKNAEKALFYRVWCRKEAQAKLQGYSLFRTISRDVLIPPQEKCFNWFPIDKNQWLCDYKVDFAFEAALACRARLKIKEYNWEHGIVT